MTQDVTETPMNASPPAAPMAAPTAPMTGPLRLTRRGRLALFVLLLVLALVGFVVWGPTVLATPDSAEPPPVQTVRVQPGDTLWDIATRLDPGANTGEVVHEIAELNRLPSTGELQIGQQIAIPAR